MNHNTLTNITLIRFLTSDIYFKFLNNISCSHCKNNVFQYENLTYIKCYICNYKYTFFDSFEKVVKLNTIKV